MSGGGGDEKVLVGGDRWGRVDLRGEGIREGCLLGTVAGESVGQRKGCTRGVSAGVWRRGNGVYCGGLNLNWHLDK